MKIFDSNPNKKDIVKGKSKYKQKLREGTISSADGAGPKSFHEVLDVKKEAIQDRMINDMMSEVDRLGSALEKAPSLNDYYTYRNAVKKLLKKIVPNAFSVQTSQSALNPRTLQRKEYHLVDVINKELESLLDLIKEKEQNHFQIAGRVVRIKGLLVDVLK